ncbi:hypothetical protein RJ639_042044 [Escallonia herrerae]|uniref:Uncharacterized protein n=1 Tax=Escallonia herrerae TaxID=1293975 RepID=A0AA88WEP3_9ASTE|nr:hypothetical protein RJ639_042044 [Escallonia herrerae]
MIIASSRSSGSSHGRRLVTELVTVVAVNDHAGGHDCGQENTLKTGDVIQCRECGYRILYKKRTRRTIMKEGLAMVAIFRELRPLSGNAFPKYPWKLDNPEAYKSKRPTTTDAAISDKNKRVYHLH